MTKFSDEALKTRPIVVMALEVESAGLIETLGWPVVYTGVGKINCAYSLMKALREHCPSLVINAGSAGSHTFPDGRYGGGTPLRPARHGCDRHRLPHSDRRPSTNSTRCLRTNASSRTLTSPNGSPIADGVCGSGDNFLQGPPTLACDLVDMEAYALARVCAIEGIPFGCLKFVTDGADHAAHEDWQVNVKRAAEALTAALSQWRDSD